MIFISIGPALLFLSTISALKEGQLRRINNNYQIWIVSLIFIFIGLIINGLIAQNSPRLITLDIIHYMFFLPGILIGAKKENWVPLDRLIRIFFLINVIYLSFFIGSYQEMPWRKYIILAFEQIPYFFWGQLYLMWPYLVLTMKDKSKFDKFITVLGTILFFYFALIFLKRSAFINLLLFMVLVFIAYRPILKLSINLKTIGLSVLSILLAIGIFLTIDYSLSIDKIVDRFIGTGGTLISALANDNRLSYDVFLVKNQLDSFEYLIGRGLGGVVMDHEHNYPEFMTNSLHNSSARHFLKGGFLLLVVWWFGFLAITKDFFFKKNKEYNAFYIPVLVPFLLSWVLGFLNTSIGFLLLMLCVGKVISKERFNKV